MHWQSKYLNTIKKLLFSSSFETCSNFVEDLDAECTAKLLYVINNTNQSINQSIDRQINQAIEIKEK